MLMVKRRTCYLISAFLAVILSSGSFPPVPLPLNSAQTQSLEPMKLEAMENYSEYSSLALVGGRGDFQIASFPNYPNVSGELQEKIDRELEPGELLKWREQPVPRFFTTASTSAFLFGIFWTAFALDWILGAWSMSRGNSFFSRGIDCFPLFGIPFVLIGFWMLSSPLLTWYQAHQTVYLITDKRAISIQGEIMTTTIHSWIPEQLRGIYRRENNDGTGDVIIKVVIESRSSVDSAGNLREEKSREEIGFMGIQNPQETERKLKELAKIAT